MESIQGVSLNPLKKRTLTTPPLHSTPHADYIFSLIASMVIGSPQLAPANDAHATSDHAGGVFNKYACHVLRSLGLARRDC